MKKLLLLFTCLISSICFSQSDTLKLKNNDIIVGEVKSVINGVLTIETPYSDSDFKVEFTKIKGLVIPKNSIIFLSNGKRLFGTINTEENGDVIISETNGQEYMTRIVHIVEINEIDDKFWSRITASIDVGYNFTKANNHQQLTISTAIGYLGEKWKFSGKYEVLNSLQDNTDDIERVDWIIEAQRFLLHRWYILGNVSFLSNTEQALKGRTSPSIGAGKYFIRTNKLYLGVALGYNYNIETYFDESLNKESSELFLSTQFNIFDFKDFKMVTGFSAYPSLSESKRFRLDYNIEFKYDLPFDFYIKAGFTVNYDNQPAVAGNETDYIFTSGLGWELD